MKKFIYGLAILLAIGIMACRKYREVVIDVKPPTDSKIQTLSGGPGGASAVNSVFIDFSTAKADSVLRSSWDLGFYSGDGFKVTFNHTTSAGVKVTTKNDLSQVMAADTIGLILAPSQTAPQPSDLAYFDDASGDITKTAIPASIPH